MFIINITYTVPLEKVDDYLPAHITYLNEQYELGNFLASGRKVPRNGGVILSNVPDKNELFDIISNDPFKIRGLANYEIIEFVPSKVSKQLEFLIK